MVVAWLDVALGLAGALVGGHFFLSSGGGVNPFFLDSADCLPFFMGEMLGISSQGCFSPKITPFVVDVVALGSPFPFAIWGSFFMSIFFDIDEKGNRSQLIKEMKYLKRKEGNII